MDTVKLKFKSVISRIAENETIRTELFREKFQLERAHFEEIYVGKFWLKESNDDLIYSYCKGCVNEQLMISGIFDYFKISAVGITYFVKDYKEWSMFLLCEKEITPEEYNEALERFKNKFFEFVRVERKVLIEKI